MEDNTSSRDNPISQPPPLATPAIRVTRSQAAAAAAGGPSGSQPAQPRPGHRYEEISNTLGFYSRSRAGVGNTSAPGGNLKAPPKAPPPPPPQLGHIIPRLLPTSLPTPELLQKARLTPYIHARAAMLTSRCGSRQPYLLQYLQLHLAAAAAAGPSTSTAPPPPPPPPPPTQELEPLPSMTRVQKYSSSLWLSSDPLPVRVLRLLYRLGRMVREAEDKPAGRYTAPVGHEGNHWNSLVNSVASSSGLQVTEAEEALSLLYPLHEVRPDVLPGQPESWAAGYRSACLEVDTTKMMVGMELTTRPVGRHGEVGEDVAGASSPSSTGYIRLFLGKGLSMKAAAAAASMEEEAQEEEAHQEVQEAGIEPGPAAANVGASTSTSAPPPPPPPPPSSPSRVLTRSMARLQLAGGGGSKAQAQAQEQHQAQEQSQAQEQQAGPSQHKPPQPKQSQAKAKPIITSIAEYAHRVVLWADAGPPPSASMEVLHLCHNPRCLNPRHLTWGTHAQNMAASQASYLAALSQEGPGRELVAAGGQAQPPVLVPPVEEVLHVAAPAAVAAAAGLSPTKRHKKQPPPPGGKKGGKKRT